MTSKEREKVSSLGLAIQSCEESIYTIPRPQTLEGMIELKMFEMKLKQKYLSHKLGVSEAKLSLILSGKQKPDILFWNMLKTASFPLFLHSPAFHRRNKDC